MKGRRPSRQGLAPAVPKRTVTRGIDGGERPHGVRLAPEIWLAAAPHECSIATNAHLHAVIFAAARGFDHEFYALALDAYVHDSERYGRPRFRLLGVHQDWLRRDGALRRAVLLDPERNRLTEADLAAPMQADSVQFLCLGGRERERHRMLSARIRCPQANSWGPSALADDKAATLAGWAGLGLDVPRFGRIFPADWKAAWQFGRQFQELVLKPNDDTEGHNVFYLSRSDAACDDKLRSGLDRCWSQGSAILQQRRDGVLYRDPEQRSFHTLALRLNLTFDGRRHRLTSGFAQIGSGPDQPASCGCRGQILPLGAVLPHLVTRSNRSRPVAGQDPLLWQQIAAQAERAASLFQGLRLIGIDVLLDLKRGDQLVPVFLEANPRPGGLCRSRLFCAVPSGHDGPGVGSAFWEGLAALGSAQQAGPGASGSTAGGLR